MPFGPFLSQQQKNEINNSMYKNNKQVPSMMTPGQTYGNASYSQQQKTDAINQGISNFFGIGKKPTTVVGPGGGNGFGLGSNNTQNTPGNSGNSGGYAGPGGNPNGSGQGEAQQKPGIGPYQGHSVSTPTSVTPTVPTRDVQKPNGAKGTQTSPGGGMPVLSAATAAQFLQNKGIGLGAFSSIQLPGSPTNPNSGGTIEAQPFSGQETSVTGNTLGAFTSNGQSIPQLDPQALPGNVQPTMQAIGSTAAQYAPLASGNGAPTRATQGSNAYTEISPTNPIYAEAFGQDLADKQNKGNTSRLNAALNDTAGMQSYMSKFGSPEQDMRRAADMAFLNTSGSQEGLRAKEAVLGQFHAGGQTYQLNDAGTEFLQGDNGKPLSVSQFGKASSYRLGTSTAEDYKNSYKGKVKEIMPTTPKQAEAPSAQNPVPVNKMPTNTNFGPIIDDETYARNTESLQGMKGVGPIINGEAYGAFLEGKREPLMRDPRK